MKTILVVDDSRAIREVVKTTLAGAGYRVVEADDGDIGLQALTEHNPDLVVCDVNMPRMDGLTFLRNVRKEAAYEAYKFTPVLMLTTESSAEIKNQGREAGAKAWLVKPFVPQKLLNAVEKLISMKMAAAS